MLKVLERIVALEGDNVRRTPLSSLVEGYTTFEDADLPMMAREQIAVRFRAEFGATYYVDRHNDEAIRRTLFQVRRAVARELYGDVVDMLINLQIEALQEDVPRKFTDRIDFIIDEMTA